MTIDRYHRKKKRIQCIYQLNIKKMSFFLGDDVDAKERARKANADYARELQ